MKKLMLGLIAILMGVMLANCGGEKSSEGGKSDVKDAKSKFMSLDEDVKKNGNSWSLEEWENYNKEYLNALEAFLFSDDINEDDFNEVYKLIEDPLPSLSGDAWVLCNEAVNNLHKYEKIVKQEQRIEDRIDELRHLWEEKKEGVKAEE